MSLWVVVGGVGRDAQEKSHAGASMVAGGCPVWLCRLCRLCTALGVTKNNDVPNSMPHLSPGGDDVVGMPCEGQKSTVSFINPVLWALPTKCLFSGEMTKKQL